MYANRETRVNQSIKLSMYGLNPGDKLEVKRTIKGRTRKFICTVIKEHERFITVDRGNYKGTVDKLSILQKEIKVERIKN